jgi:hypothetical protein
MDSPFVNNNNNNEKKDTIIMYLEPMLEPYQNIYLKVITLSGKPNGPLANLTRRIHVPKLSPFETFSITSKPFSNCIYVLARYPYTNNDWMVEEDIPNILTYLQNNNYQIEKTLTELSQKRNHKVICVFSFLSK